MRDHGGAVAGGVKARCGREADSERNARLDRTMVVSRGISVGGIIVIVGIVSMIV
jgi:hypothetical protein